MTFRHQPSWCEENVWHLCREARFTTRDPHAVFISNARRAAPVWFQSAAPDGEPVLWDYHVVLLARGDAAWEVWDLDTTLALPVTARRYAELALAAGRLAPPWAQNLRVVAAPDFVATFRSDRSHMRTPDGTGWTAPPPQWEPIGDGGSNLWDFVDMDAEIAGDVLTATQFRDRYA